MALDIISYQRYWVAPSNIIPNVLLEDGRNLRDVVSNKGLCFVQLLCSIHDDLHKVSVARSLRLLDDYACSKQIFLTAEEFSRTIPWDNSLQYLSIDELREQVEAYNVHDGSILDYSQATSSHSTKYAQFQEEIDLVALPPVFVSNETLQEALKTMEDSKATSMGVKRRSWLQLSWFRAALFALAHQITLMKEQSSLAHSLMKLDGFIRRVLVCRHRFHQKLVNASPVYYDDGLVGWHVRIGVPLPLTYS